MKRTLCALALIAALLGGCKTTESLKVFEKDQMYDKALRYTKHAQLIRTFETRAKISATYLNPVYADKYSDAQYFVVGIFIPDDFDNKDQSGLSNKDFSLLLDSKKPIKVEELDRASSSLLRQIPLTDNWSRYYLVSFESGKSQKEFKMTLSHSTYGQVALVFPASDAQ